MGLQVSQLPEALDCVQPGWWPILDELHADLIQLDPEYGLGGIKEKFGGLRVHLSTYGSPEIWAAINKAEMKSYDTCEFCGAPGEPRRPKKYPAGWIRTVCEVCWT